ncbi:MAG: hypothetical protein LC640_10710 [Frankia sp.]|nr:hypothetical protein [Frankia sp.]
MPVVVTGADEALDFDELVRFGAVLEGAHTVVHVRRGARALGGEDGNGGIADVLSAAEETGVQRIVTLAPATPSADDEAALRELARSDYDTVVFRVGTEPDLTRLAIAIVAADEDRDVHGHVVVVDATGNDPLEALHAAISAAAERR